VRNKSELKHAGHAEVQGETLAKFELFQNGWNPYSRYLDVDKIDLLLRRRSQDGTPQYREIQVKYGKLYTDLKGWERKCFDRTSWKFVDDKEFAHLSSHKHFYVVYVLASDQGYEQDIFVFPVSDFIDLTEQAVLSETKSGPRRKLYFSRMTDASSPKWIMRKKNRSADFGSEALLKQNGIDITKYRRAFDYLE
jgi:hypothetical protein